MRLLLSHWFCSENVNVFIIHSTQVYTSDVELSRRPFIVWGTEKDLLTGYQSKLEQKNSAVSFCFPSRFVLKKVCSFTWIYSAIFCFHPPPLSLIPSTIIIQLPGCHWVYQGHALDDVSENLGLFMSWKIILHWMMTVDIILPDFLRRILMCYWLRIWIWLLLLKISIESVFQFKLAQKRPLC